MLKCELHTHETIAFACLDMNCCEPSRFLCNDCAIFSPNHKDHLSHIVNIDQLLASTDGSSIRFLCDKVSTSESQSSHTPHAQFARSKLPFQLTKHQVNMYFDVIQRQLIEELQRARAVVLSACDLQDSLQANIDSQLLILEARISSFIEDFLFPSPSMNKPTITLPPLPKNPSLPNLHINQIHESSSINFNKQISQEITAELFNFNETRYESIVEAGLLAIQTLKESKLNLQPFEQDLSHFISSGQSNKPPAVAIASSASTQSSTNETSLQSPLSQSDFIHSILQNRFSTEFTNEHRIQLLHPAEFYTSIGYSNCIAISSLEDLHLLRQVSLQICSDSEKSAQQHHNQQLSLPAQRSFFFSVLLDNKDIGDREAIAVAKQLERIRYVANIHLDFDENDITDTGYTSLFRSLENFVRLEHIDLRFNRNFAFGPESAARLVELLEKHKSSLRVLCLTIRSLRPSSQQKRDNLSDSTSPLSSSSSSFSQSLSASMPQISQTHSNHYPQLHVQYSSQSQQQPQFQQEHHLLNLQSSYSVKETIGIILETISKLTSLEVVYLDFSDNNLAPLGSTSNQNSNRSSVRSNSSTNVELFSSIFTLPLISTIHIVLNRTHFPSEDSLALIKNMMKLHPSPFQYLKLFLKENEYSFQQQRTISGQFQKIQAQTKNFDLFY